MQEEFWNRAEKLAHDALQRTPDDRKGYLDHACGEDVELCRLVNELISKDENAATVLERALFTETVTIRNERGSLVGKQLGSYHIESLLGAGGMGEVYRAHDGKLDRDVAIKTLPVQFACNNERVARLRREARMLAALNHPNIAAIYGLEEFDDQEYLVMELVEGDTLAGPLPIGVALDRARQIAEALEAAHNKGVVHRDLKPANVKVTPQGKVKILDFGLAKAIGGPELRRDNSNAHTMSAAQTGVGVVMGTPGYMSPEQAIGQQVDKRADIWAFGCLLYELLTGRRAFRGENTAGTIAAVLDREPEWSELPSKTPTKIHNLLRRCLEKNPDARLGDIGAARVMIEESQPGRNVWRVAAIAVVVAVLSVAGALWLRTPSRPLDRSDWVKLTDLTDSAAQPALSPDGRMLAFIRGPGTFVSPGQVYVKMLPDGVPVPLTHDNVLKMSPVFSADGSRIAYTARTPPFNWDTWSVPVTGGEPQMWLRNASGLTWTAPHELLFSEIKEGLHMGLVSTEDNRMNARNVYLPGNERGMAHRSYLSPDRKWVLLVEMDKDGLWGPCRVVPFDGSSGGRLVGPPGADCTFGAWSPDGKWLYVTSKSGGSNHIWRQQFPDGTPQQVTSGPTEEEGVAMAPDGRSFVTAVALETGAIWVHDSAGDRQISLEGNAFYARFTPDGEKLCYLVTKSVVQPGTTRDPGEVWIADLATGRSQAVAPGFQAYSYDISPDGRQIVMEVLDKNQRARLWLAPMDRSSAPHQIAGVEGRESVFGSSGDIFFRRAEGSSGFVYRVHSDGTGLRKALERPVLILYAVSPDERWILAWAALENNLGSGHQAIPLDGGRTIHLDPIGLSWAPGGRTMSILAGGHSYITDLPPGKVMPSFPAKAVLTESDFAALPGTRRIEQAWVSPGPTPDRYAYYKASEQRNLYRIPIR